MNMQSKTLDPGGSPVQQKTGGIVKNGPLITVKDMRDQYCDSVIGQSVKTKDGVIWEAILFLGERIELLENKTRNRLS